MSPHDRSETCKEIFTLLSEYLDLELPAETCQEITKHLADCPACVEFAASLRRTIDLCRQYRPAEIPGPLGQQAREQLLSAYTRMLNDRKT
jgi:anti-sigma factor RsiW